MAWVCTKCGECCRHIGNIPALARYALEDGSCRFLEGNLCSIYDRRPTVCNVGKIYGEFFRGKVSEEEFYEKNAEACKKLQEGHSLVSTPHNCEVSRPDTSNIAKRHED